MIIQSSKNIYSFDKCISRVKVLITLFSFYCTVFAYSQSRINGRVINAVDQSPISFASIVADNDPQKGAFSDINGYFFIQDNSIQKLTCSHIGFETQEKNIVHTDEIIFYLKPITDSLKEVILNVENPAKAIIKQVIANRNQNNPLKLPSFTYQSYSKTIFDIENKTNIIENSLYNQDVYLFIMENTSTRKFLYPYHDEEVITATRVSGLKDPRFGLFATDLQPFSFYENTINLFDINYINPISPGAIDNYHYYLEETRYIDRDTLHVISYRPIPGKNFEGLTGIMQINRKNFAVQSVTAKPFNKPKMEINIKQLYSQTDTEVWFPEQLHYEIMTNALPYGKDKDSVKIIVTGQTFITDVATHISLSKKEFSANNVFIRKNEVTTDSLYWKSQRKLELNPKEIQTYRIIDSIGNELNMDNKIRFFEKIINGKIPIGVVDMDAQKIIDYNHYEGFRLGAGIDTNKDLFEKISVGGYFAYGFKDHTWKYGTNLRYYIDYETDFYTQISYQNDLIEAGNHGLKLYSQTGFDYRKFMGFKYDKHKQLDIKVNTGSIRYLNGQLGVNHSVNDILYPYVFNSDNQWIKSYTVSSLYFCFRYGYGEKKIRVFDKTFYNESNFPVFYLYYSKGFKDLWGGSFNFNKIELALEHSFYINKIGKTSYRVEAGYVDSSLPLSLLFTGKGARDKNVFFLVKNNFQTMHPYEFLSDSYVNIFFNHNFESLLFRAKGFQPDIVVHTNLGWGRLSNQENHYPISFSTKEHIFLESGLLFENLLKFNYMNIVNLGLGCGAFYRYGNYANNNQEDNVVFKLDFSLSIK